MVSRTYLFMVVAIVLIAVVLIASLIIIYSGPSSNLTEKPGMLFQVSAFNTFSAGNFDGNTTFGNLSSTVISASEH